MSTYEGPTGGHRDPNTPGGYCLRICRCGHCPQYAEQQRQAEVLRAQEYDARTRLEGARAARLERAGRRGRNVA